MDGKETIIAEDLYGKIDPKVKAALTRAYNKETHTVKFLKPKAGADMASKVGKGKKVGRSGEELHESDDDYQDDDDDAAAAEDQAVEKKKTPAAAKPSKGAGAKAGAAPKKAAAPRKKK